MQKILVVRILELKQIEMLENINNNLKYKKTFREEISFRENKQDIDLINFVRNNIDMLKTMSIDELDKIEKAIENRQAFVDKKIAKLKTDLIMKKKNIQCPQYHY